MAWVGVWFGDYQKHAASAEQILELYFEVSDVRYCCQDPLLLPLGLRSIVVEPNLMSTGASPTEVIYTTEKSKDSEPIR